MNLQLLIFGLIAVVLSHVGAEENVTTPSMEDVEIDWSGMVDCFSILTNETSIPLDSDLSPTEVTIDLLKAICGTKEQFLSCVDSSLSNADESSVAHLFRPLFNVTIVADAYDDLCQNLTVSESEKDLTCLINSTALLPCYREYHHYLFYLSVIRRFGSPQRQLSDDVVNTLLCTLAEQRRDCEVAALSVCSTKLGDIMQSFYQKTLPSACHEEDQEAAPETEETPDPTEETPDFTEETPDDENIVKNDAKQEEIVL